MIFANRTEAGKFLAEKLKKYQKDSPLVFGLPRGGVVVASEIAKTLNAPLDVLIVRKIGAPDQQELAIGAISEKNISVFDEKFIKLMEYNREEIKRLRDLEIREVERQVNLYRKGKTLVSLKDKTVIIVDDGIATGQTAQVAIKTAALDQPKKIILATPVITSDTFEKLKTRVFEIIYLEKPADLQAISNYYQEFTQISDKEVLDYLEMN